MSNKNTILIVDDNDLLREVLVDLLSLRGLMVLSAKSGSCAFKMILENPDISVVISDVRMPNGDGHDLMAALHVLERAGKPSLILISGNADEPNSLAVKKYGVHHVLVKPFDKQHLFDAVEQCLTESSSS